MNASLEAKIVELYRRRSKQNEITAGLHTNRSCISRSVRHFHETGLIPDALRIGHPSKVTSELTRYIEGRTIQEPLISGKSIIRGHFRRSGVWLSRPVFHVIRVGQHFKYR
jgi:hypothetical protein